MSAPAEVLRAAEAVLGARIRLTRPLAGGDINDAYALELEDGSELFVKTSPQAPAGSFTAEAAGLEWIAAAPGGPRVPQVRAVVDPGQETPARMLILEHIRAGRLSDAAAERFGRELAALHRAGAPAHGSPPPVASAGALAHGAPSPLPSGAAAEQTGPSLFVGPLRLPTNQDPSLSWPEVYGALRLMPVAELADARGALPTGGLAVVAALCERLAEVSGPDEPPARLHGDLWSGNLMADQDGAPCLIDPAAYGGHREIDLAMLRLFGGPGERCFAAYEEVHPLGTGHGERVRLWQLFPLLVHAALFGGGYGERAVQAARAYL